MEVTSGLKSIYPDMTVAAREIVPNALLYQVASIAGQVDGDQQRARVPVIAEDPDAGFILEGAPITPDQPTLAEVTVRTAKIAVAAQLSNEAYRSLTAASLMSVSLRRSIVKRADIALLEQPDGGQPPAGLLNLDFPEIGALTDDLDVFTDAAAAVETAEGAPSVWLFHPLDWAHVAKLKDSADSNRSLVGAGTEAAQRTLNSIPVIAHPRVTQGSALLLDSTDIVAVESPLTLAVSDQVAFLDDAVVIRVTWRIGWNVLHADRHAVVTIDSGGS